MLQKRSRFIAESRLDGSEARRDLMPDRSNTSRSPGESPLISVVMVVFNAVATMRTTIQSLADQTYRHVDFVVIDGGSTDGTLEVLHQYRDRIDYQSSEKDNGIYDAMNKGVAAARGDWIVFLNSGDTFAGPEVLHKIFGRELPSQIDVIYGNTVLKSSREIMRLPANIDKKFFYFETLCHQSIFARRELFERIGKFGAHYRIIGDREWLFRLAEAGGRFAHVDVDVCVWDPEGFSSANAAVSQLEVSEFQSRHFTRSERALLPWVMRLKNLGRKLGRGLTRLSREQVTHV